MPTKSQIVREDIARVARDVSCLTTLRGQSVVITGGTGFLGTWLTELLAYLNDVHGFNIEINLLATRPTEFADQAPHLAGRADVNLIACDVSNLVELPWRAQYIIHAAASPDNRQHASDPLRTIRTIVHGTHAVMEAASRLSDLKGVLHISSGQVYGVRPVDAIPINEQSFEGFDSTSITNVYAEAKRMAEGIASAYRSQHRLPIVTIRPFSFVGPYQSLERPWAINNFIRDTLHDGPVRIQGDGLTTRGYMYGADLAWWVLNLLVQAESGHVYNVGNPHAISLIELARMVTSLMPVPPRVTTGSFGESVPKTAFIPDTSAAMRDFDLTCVFDLPEALRRTIQWHLAAQAD